VRSLAGQDADEKVPTAIGRPIRVLWLIKGLGRGGAELLLSTAARVRNRDAFEYEAAYLLDYKSELAGELRRLGVPVHLLRARTEFDLGWAVRLRKLLLDRPVDVVHVHSPYVAGIVRLIVRTIPRRMRPRLLSTEHNAWGSFTLPTRLLNGATFLLDDGHLAVSEAVRRSIPGPLRTKVQVLNHGIPVDDARALTSERNTVRKELGIAEDEFAIGTVANYRSQKGYPHLFEAAAAVVNAGVPARFVSVGHGALHDQIHALHKQSGLGDRFMLLGRREDAIRVMSGCDVFALASLYEGLPLAVMEALTLGLPVVATEVGGIPELVTNGVEGLLVPAARPQLLAGALVSLYRDPARCARMATAARIRSSDFDHVYAMHIIENVYRSVAARATRS